MRGLIRWKGATWAHVSTCPAHYSRSGALRRRIVTSSNRQRMLATAACWKQLLAEQTLSRLLHPRCHERSVPPDQNQRPGRVNIKAVHMLQRVEDPPLLRHQCLGTGHHRGTGGPEL